MEGLNEALERIDSSYQFALSGRREQARQQYQDNWSPYLGNLNVEGDNITLPGEAGVVRRARTPDSRVSEKGGCVLCDSARRPRARSRPITGPRGSSISSSRSKTSPAPSCISTRKTWNTPVATRGAWPGFPPSGSPSRLAAAFVLAGFAAWQTVRTILRPIQAMTHAALGISAGNLDQIVPYHSSDELGQLAEAFNTMTRHLARRSPVAVGPFAAGSSRQPRRRSTPFPTR